MRIVLKTDDDAIIGMSYPGIRHGPKEVLDRIARGESGQGDGLLSADRGVVRDFVGKIRLAQQNH